MATSSAMSEKWHALDVASRDVPAIGHHGFGYRLSATGCLEDGKGEGERAEREKGRAACGTWFKALPHSRQAERGAAIDAKARKRLRLPNGTPAYLNSSGRTILCNGRRCDGDGKTTKARGAHAKAAREKGGGRAAAAAAAAAKVWEGLFKPYWPSHTVTPPPTRDRRRRYRLDTTRRQDRSARQRRRPSGGSFPITCFCREAFTHSEEKGEKGKGGREKGRKGEREEGTMGKGRAEKRTGKSGKGGE